MMIKRFLAGLALIMTIPTTYANTADYSKLAVGDWLCHFEYQLSNVDGVQYENTYSYVRRFSNGRYKTYAVGQIRIDGIDGIHRSTTEGTWQIDGIHRSTTEGTWQIDGDQYRWQTTEISQLDYSDRLDMVGFGKLANTLRSISVEIIRLDDKNFDMVYVTDDFNPLYFYCTRL